jgi:hypothetical protein
VDPIKSVMGHVTSNLCFCIWWDMHVTSCVLVCLGCETSTHDFSYSGGPGADPIKSAWGHVTPNLHFLHLVRYVCHIVHSGASGEENVAALLFMLEWAR